MALLSQKIEPIGAAKLEKWEFIASGGFGDVYKARQKDWGFDVAVKLTRNAASSPSSQLSHPSLLLPDKALRDEADHMDKASFNFVLRIYGIYQGIPPNGGGMQQGIVMELMERGSVQTLLTKLRGSPPRPLAFRLAHQVALGMNFLHSLNIIHHDLKPSNVLLTADLNARIADFGLSRVSTSVLNASDETPGVVGGSYKYMPPEAFTEASYEPVRAFDRYSYGILLWSIFSGKEPYPDKDYHLVAFRIPLGDRPCCDQLNHEKELEEMVALMKRCWDKNANVRPTFQDCLNVTEKLFSMHKKGLPDAVCSIQKTLDSTASDEEPNTSETSTSKTSRLVSNSSLIDRVDHSPAPAQKPGAAPTIILTAEEKAKFVKENFPELVQEVSEVMAIAEELGDMVHSEVLSSIEAEKTRQDKMRLLYSRIVRPAGTKVKAAFYDALKKHHPALVEKLGG